MTQSSISELVNKAGIIKLKNGATTIFYGLKIEDKKFIYYTAKGIRELLIMRNSRSPLATDEQALQQSHHIACVPCDNIAELVRLNKWSSN